MNGEEDDDPNLSGILTIRDDNHECLWALPVDGKGPVECVVKWIVDRLDNVVYRGETITIKSDQWPDVMALKLQWLLRELEPQPP